MNSSDGKILLCPLVVLPRRERRQGVWALYLKSGDPEFRSCPDHYLDSPPWLCLDLTCSLKSRVIVILAFFTLCSIRVEEKHHRGIIIDVWNWICLTIF